MTARRLGLISLCAWMLALLPVSTIAQSSVPPLRKGKVLTAQEMSERIDARMEARWKEEGIKPAPLANDMEFLRRAFLDLQGRIPIVREIHDFVDDSSSDKRARMVEFVMKKPAFTNHLAAAWRNAILPQSNDRLVATYAGQIENWLRGHFANDKNTPFDEMVRELLTAPVTFQRGGNRQYNASALGFYQANLLKPEDIAASASRLFMGVRLECAQCHDHPFNVYTRTQFWEQAAFFAGLSPQRRFNGRPVGFQDKPEVHEITIPGTKRVVKARFLDGEKPEWPKKNVNARETFADWLTSPKNPYFSKAIVNRFWEHFFGLGLVDPVDEMGEDNPGNFPKLLSEMADQFAKNKFDSRYLIRAITRSKAYQRTSAKTHKSQDDPLLFARMNLKGLTTSQLYQSLLTATRFPDPSADRIMRGGVIGFGNTPAAEIQRKFANSADKRTEFRTSILQALTLMNGKLVSDATSLTRSETLASIVNMPLFSDTDKLEALYLSALSRKPTKQELARLLPYVAKGGPSGDPKKAFADVFWALLNSSEFILNH